MPKDIRRNEGCDDIFVNQNYIWIYEVKLFTCYFYLNELTQENVVISWTLWWWAEEQIGSEGAQRSMWWSADRSQRLMPLKLLITLCIRHHALKALHIVWKVTASLDKIPSGAVYTDAPEGTFGLLVKGQAREFWRKRALKHQNIFVLKSIQSSHIVLCLVILFFS